MITRLAIGDSLMVDAGSELSAAGFTVDAAVGRQFADVVEILAPLRADGRLGDVVVLSVAEDGPIDRATADQVMTELTEVNNVIILTSSGDHPVDDHEQRSDLRLGSHIPERDPGRLAKPRRELFAATASTTTASTCAPTANSSTPS